MKTIFKIHPLMIFVSFICILTGMFKDYIYIFLLIIVHEIGHTTGALYFDWNIKKVIILPFGGITIFNELINKSLFEEFVILALGPLFQILFYFILCYLNLDNDLIREYHYGLLLFNMMPIIPLDGSKLVNIMLNRFFNFKLSYTLTIIISLITIILELIYMKSLVLLLILFFLIMKNIKDIRDFKYVFNKFLFEHYYYDFYYKKFKIIKGIRVEKMKKNYRHLFYKNGYYTQKEILKNYFGFEY